MLRDIPTSGAGPSGKPCILEGDTPCIQVEDQPCKLVGETDEEYQNFIEQRDRKGKTQMY